MRLWALIGVLALVAPGCSSKLETGYQPRKLGATETERRGFYAAPYTAAARAAEAERSPAGEIRRPGVGY